MEIYGYVRACLRPAPWVVHGCQTLDLIGSPNNYVQRRRRIAKLAQRVSAGPLF
jgi:hypothetical protein